VPIPFRLWESPKTHKNPQTQNHQAHEEEEENA
jgi:hypothetical protein